VTGPVLVTGGTGFVGRALVERLVAAGRPVAALARSEEAAGTLAALGATPRLGDLLDPDSLVAAARGAEAVFHLAGVNALCPADPDWMLLVNVEGSRNVMRAAGLAGVRRVVHTSSAATLGEAVGTEGNEDTRHRGSFLSTYERSKTEAERVVLAAAAAGGPPAVCVNPASVQGPGRVRGTARILLDHLNGRLRLVVDARFSVVDVADCVEGHLLAEARGRPGERYVLSGATLTVGEALALLDQIAGPRPAPRRLPPRAAMALATAAERVARLRRRPPSVCREMMRTLLHGHAYDGSRAAHELGLEYTPIEDSIRRTVAWYVDQGLAPALPPKR